MLPDYLPIIQVNQLQTVSGRRSRLFEALRGQIIEKGLRLGEMERLLQSKESRADQRITKDIVSNDLLVVHGQCDTDCAQLLLGEHGEVQQVMNSVHPCFSCQDVSEVEPCADDIFNWLVRCMTNTPLWGCILIGGKSSRMGRPKHLIVGSGGRSWLEQSLDTLSLQVADMVISGGGEIPQGLDSIKRVGDLPGLSGPMAGISAVIMKHPFVSWIVMACDMPDVTEKSIRWIIDQRRPGRLAVIPRNPITGRGEPLFGWYDFRSAPLFDDLAARKELRMNSLGACAGVFRPLVPDDLIGAWRNVNRPDELDHQLFKPL